jgi:predicted ATPase
VAVQPSAETESLYQAIRAGQLDRAVSGGEQGSRTDSHPRIPSPRHNLPLQPTPFIGRKTELAVMDKWMDDQTSRLVTIVGPGGIGKTRLALACGDHQLTAGTRFPNGIFFVNLALLNEADQIIPTLAGVLDFQLQSRQDGHSPQQQLLDYLRPKRLLLLLDNFDHLLSPPVSPSVEGIRRGAELVADILQAAPEVQILVTSRERLHLRTEQVYPIEGLEFPDWETPEDAAGYTAVQLFLQSARRNQPDFALRDGADLTNLAHICCLVAGMPLALELAASWVDMLPLAEIAAELQKGLNFLETDMQDIPERHRSIRAAIDYSWHKLDEKERDIFAKLSVFRG